jgi:histidinol-phosphate phosphatase family protein
MTERAGGAAFLDRDGTIIEDVPYIRDPGKVALIPGAAEAIRRLNARGIVVIVLTNQSGLSRGYFTEEELDAVNSRMIALLEEKGARVDRIYYCPHLPAELLPPGEEPCDCRKPGTGLVERARRELEIDPGRSYFFGDRRTDVELGENAGGRPILVLTGQGTSELEGLRARGMGQVIVAKDLLAGVSTILSDKEEKPEAPR